MLEQGSTKPEHNVISIIYLSKRSCGRDSYQYEYGTLLVKIDWRLIRGIASFAVVAYK